MIYGRFMGHSNISSNRGVMLYRLLLQLLQLQSTVYFKYLYFN